MEVLDGGSCTIEDRGDYEVYNDLEELDEVQTPNYPSSSKLKLPGRSREYPAPHPRHLQRY